MATKGGSVVFEFQGDDKNLKNISSSLGKGISTAMKGGAIAVGALSTALGGLIGSATKSYADLEQNLGGIETLFKDSSETVINNAKKAYETAGMSANDYMQTVTGFSASLLQSLDGDTKKAASYADRAITDMADNANKMGTSMESIQYAYQGFAKQNYTMLDNLKLGYGGTKEEMARLISDASKLTDVQKELGITVDANDMSFGNIVNAISVVQKNMGIMGTTSKEASTTITGSVNSMKASFDNFLNGTGTPEQLSKSIVTALKNVGNAVGKLAPNIISGITELSDGLLKELPKAVESATPALIDGALQLINSLVSITPQIMTSLEAIAPAIINGIVQTLNGMITALPIIATSVLNMMNQVVQLLIPQLPTIAQSLLNGILQIITQISEVLPTMLPMIVQGILSIVPLILENIPQLIDTGISLLMGLIDGLINSIPILVDSIPAIIEGLVQAFVGGIPRLITVAPQLIMALARAIVTAIPSLLYSIPQIIGAIVNGLIDGLVSIKDVGKNLIKGLWEGMLGTFDWLVGKIKGFADSILGGIKSFFGIHSPSTEFAWIGKMNVLGLEEGMEDMQGDLNETIGNMVQLSPSLIASASNTYNPNINVLVQNSFEQDPLGQMVQTRKTFSGGAKNDFNYGSGVVS